jgi:outer membrane protein TolC
LALTSVEVGKSSVVAVLRLQMRTNEIQQLSSTLEQQYLSEQTTFNKLLNRDKNITITVLDAMDIPSIDFETNSEKLIFHPELLKYDKLYQSIMQSEVLNQKESNPMIGFGFDYVNVAKRPDMNFGDNGKDILMPMLTVSIPIFNTKRTSKTKQNNLQQEELLAQKQERLNALKVLLDTAINNRTSARISYETQAKNLKQAKYAEEILVKNYETVTIDFKDLLEIQELQLKFEMNIIESVNSYYVQTTIINYLTQ